MLLKSDFLKHKIALQRLALGRSNIFRQKLLDIEEIVKTRYSLGMMNTPNALKLLKADLLRMFSGISEDVLESLIEIGQYEARFSARTINKRIPSAAAEVPTPKAIEAVIKKTPMATVVGKPEIKVTKALITFGNNTSDKMVSVIRDSRIKNETPEQMSLVMKALIAGIIYTQVKSLITSLVNHSAAQARNAVMEKSKLKYWEWVAELDDNLCPDCEEEAGNVYPMSEPFVPLHYNCRCEPIPLDDVDS